MQGVCTQGVHAQGWWGHSANQITGGDTQPIRLQVRAGVVRAGVVGTLSQSDYTGLRARMRVQGLCAGGVRAGGACKGVVGTLSQSDYTGVVHTGVAHAGVVRTGVVHAGVVGTLSQSDYTRVVCKDACARVARAGGCAQGW